MRILGATILIPVGLLCTYEAVEFYCTTITVPLSWRKRDVGKPIKLALMRARQKELQEPKGGMFLNFGGPGLS